MEDKKLVVEVYVPEEVELNISEIARNVIRSNNEKGRYDVDDIIEDMGYNIEHYLEEAGYNYEFSDYQLDNCIYSDIANEIERILS